MEKRFNQKKYIKEYRDKRKKQFNTDLDSELFYEITDFLNGKGISKAEFIRTAYSDFKNGRYTMKIKELNEINILKDKTSILLNHNIDSDFYDYFFEKDISWLVENKQKIEKDFTNNLEKMKFDIIINSKLDERYELVKSLKNVSIKEFSKYISFIPFDNLDKSIINDMEAKFDYFKSINDDYQLIQYFNSICRK